VDNNRSCRHAADIARLNARETEAVMGDGEDKALRLKDVLALTTLSRATLKRLELSGQFPNARRAGPGVRFWLRSEVVDWMRACPTRSDS
jgi:predicted DNA-binding transcriptional regulator AlpA